MDFATYLLFHLGRHVALDDLQGISLFGRKKLAVVADSEAALAQQLSDLIYSAIGVIRAGGLDDLRRRRRRVLLVLGRPQLRGGLRLNVGGFGRSLGIGIPRGQSLQVNAASGRQPVGHGCWMASMTRFERWESRCANQHRRVGMANREG